MRLAVKLLIRPVLRAGPVRGNDERTSHKQDTPKRSVKTRVTFASPSTTAQHIFSRAAHRILTVKFVVAGSGRRNGDWSRCCRFRASMRSSRSAVGFGVVDGSGGGHAVAVWLCLGSGHPEVLFRLW